MKSFRFEAAQVWNSLPNEVRLAENYKQFRRLLKTWDGVNFKFLFSHSLFDTCGWRDGFLVFRISTGPLFRQSCCPSPFAHKVPSTYHPQEMHHELKCSVVFLPLILREMFNSFKFCIQKSIKTMQMLCLFAETNTIY